MSILYPDSGSIKVLGDSEPERVKDRLGYLPEEKGLYKKMKCRELIAYFGTLKGLVKSDALIRADKLLSKFELSHCADMRCESLSKGMAQKVQIMSTLIHDPEVIILDEPFSGLDPINVELVRNVILDLKREGRTVIFSTHVMEQAEQICDAILLIDHGRKLLDGMVADIKQGYKPTIILEYEGDSNLLNQPGVSRVNNMGRTAELSLEDRAVPQEILRQLMEQLTLHGFSIKEPSLHEIFVRTVRSATP